MFKPARSGLSPQEHHFRETKACTAATVYTRSLTLHSGNCLYLILFYIFLQTRPV